MTTFNVNNHSPNLGIEVVNSYLFPIQLYQPRSKERLVHAVSAQSTPWTRGKNAKHVLSTRRRLNESTVNRQIELRGNIVTRRGSSVKTPQSPSGRRDDSTCKIFK
uniref:Uncharacterized protein n=1 Tax=Magallana gigas TaxID=29159 RepID=K1PBS2_MAGGI